MSGGSSGGGVSSWLWGSAGDPLRTTLLTRMNWMDDFVYDRIGDTFNPWDTTGFTTDVTTTDIEGRAGPQESSTQSRFNSDNLNNVVNSISYAFAYWRDYLEQHFIDSFDTGEVGTWVDNTEEWMEQIDATAFIFGLAQATQSAGFGSSSRGLMTSFLSSARSVLGVVDDDPLVKSVFDDANTQADTDIISASLAAGNASRLELFTTTNEADGRADTMLDSGVTKAINLLLNDTDNYIQLAFTQALTVAQAAIDDTVIDSIVDAFESNLENEFYRSKNRFASSAVEANASNGLAFWVGMATIESDHSKQITQFRAELEKEIFYKTHDQFISTFTTALQVYISNYFSYLQQYLSTFAALKDTALKTWLQAYLTFPQIYANALGTLAQHESSGFNNLVKSGDEGVSNWLNAFKGILDTSLRSFVADKANSRTTGTDFVKTTGLAYASNKAQWAGLYQTYTHNQYLRDKSNHDDIIKWYKEKAAWENNFMGYPMDMWQEYSNIVAGMAGATSSVGGTKPTMAETIGGGIGGGLAAAALPEAAMAAIPGGAPVAITAGILAGFLNG